MSLRTRLVVGLLALLTAGLAVGNVVTYRALESFLRHRVDEQLLAVRQSAADVLAHAAGERFGPDRGRAEIPGVTYAELRSPAGSVRYVTRGVAEPDLDDLTALGFTTVGSKGEGPSYRVNISTGRDGVLLVAQSLADVDSTLRRLLGVELLASSLILGGLAALSLWLVRIVLRPLDDMTEAAGSIAAGDLSRRVPEGSNATEVGRLGSALNTMLSRIEEAFDERRRSEDRLRRFVADASHELRTPLTSIRGYAELFRRGASERPEDLANAMRRIEEEGARMGLLVDDMLLLARLDQHRPLEREPVDLVQVCEDAAADLRATDPDRPVTVTVVSPVTVVGDEARLRQVLTNLLGNTREHTPAGTPVAVRVGTAPDGAGKVARVEVADAGPGIPAERAARVFERFFRVDETRSRGTGGSGLGLSIVAAIAEAHGGSASLVDPPAGQAPPGTTIRVDLPLGGPPAGTSGGNAPLH
jgi:two-component system OmpR family sensor kinase